MKSIIFSNAWKLVKQFSISISKALTIAWKEFKLELVSSKINALELKIMTPEQKEQLKNLYSVAKILNIALQSIKPVVEYVFNNDGAAAYYDGKTLNLD